MWKSCFENVSFVTGWCRGRGGHIWESLGICVSFHLPSHWGKPLLHVVLAQKVSPPTCWDSIQNLGWSHGNVTVSLCGSKTSFSKMCFAVFLMWPPSVVILCFSITCCSSSNVKTRCEGCVSKQCFVLLQTCLHTHTQTTSRERLLCLLGHNKLEL